MIKSVLLIILIFADGSIEVATNKTKLPCSVSLKKEKEKINSYRDIFKEAGALRAHVICSNVEDDTMGVSR